MALTIDNMFMCTEKDEAHYHEMISHPAMFAHGNVKKVLIIGGGDGASVREIVKHSSVEKVVMVEIDANVVEASKKHLPQMASAFDHPKLELIIGDGIEYVAKAAPKSFDYIIVDGSDPVGPAEGLFSEKFYRDCKNALDVTEPNEKALAEFQRPHALKYYNTEVHRAAFALPNYVKEMLNE